MLDAAKGEHTTLPYRGFAADVTPQEQWDNIPVIGKLQILTFVGMLESYGEIPATCRTTRIPPSRATTRRSRATARDPLRPYKPFDIFPEQTEEKAAASWR